MQHLLSGFMHSAHWLWLAGGFVLLGLETLAPGVFLLWIGLAAVAAGLLFWLLPLGFSLQLMIFAAFALCAILIGRRIQTAQKTDATDAPFLNDRGGALLGKVFTLHTAITDGIGSVRIGDSVWRVSGADAEAGMQVKITGIDGSTLRVEAAAKPQ
jgi:inner membrane protein